MLAGTGWGGEPTGVTYKLLSMLFEAVSDPCANLVGVTPAAPVLRQNSQRWSSPRVERPASPGQDVEAPAPCLSHQAPAHPLVPESLTPHRRVSSNVQEGQVQPPLQRYVETALLMTRKPSTLSLLASAWPPFLWGDSKGMWSLAKLV